MSSDQSPNQSIAQQTRAIVFLGTPHRGSAFTAFGSWVARALWPLGANPSILAGLEYDSIPLLDLHSDFIAAVSDNLRVFNFFEQRPLELLRVGFFRWRQFVSGPLDAE